MIIRRGTSCGLNWFVAYNPLAGHKTAYIEIPKDIFRHVFMLGDEFDSFCEIANYATFCKVDLKLDLHGGCTYVDNTLPGFYDQRMSNYYEYVYVGWDYAHIDDIDIKTHQTIVSDDIIIANIKDAISQLAKLRNS